MLTKTFPGIHCYIVIINNTVYGNRSARSILAGLWWKKSDCRCSV